jgi:hypothetical protein
VAASLLPRRRQSLKHGVRAPWLHFANFLAAIAIVAPSRGPTPVVMFGAFRKSNRLLLFNAAGNSIRRDATAKKSIRRPKATLIQNFNMKAPIKIYGRIARGQRSINENKKEKK